MQAADPARAALVIAQPALGGHVAHDPVRRRPACAEQLGEHGVVRLEQSALVLRVGVALVQSRKRVPTTTASAPAASAASTSARSATPPASQIGKLGARAARARSSNSSAGVVPRTWPPASTPCTITPSAPASVAAFVSSTDPH